MNTLPLFQNITIKVIPTGERYPLAAGLKSTGQRANANANANANAVESLAAQLLVYIRTPSRRRTS